MPELPDIHRLDKMDNAVSLTTMPWDYHNLTPKTKAILERSGWYPDRKIPTENFRMANESLGTQFFEVAELFLSSVGGLTLEYPHFANPSAFSNCCFDPIAACDRANIQRIRLYERHLNTPLCVIGEENHGYLTVLITKSGEIYAGYECDLITVGDTPAVALNNLCSGRELPVVEVSGATNDGLVTGRDLAPEVVAAFKGAGVEFEDTLQDKSGCVLDTFRAKYGGVCIDCLCADGSHDKLKLFAATEENPWQCPIETHSTIGEPVTPIGQVVDAGIRLVMTKDGQIFGFLPELPSTVWRYGSSVEEALNNIVLGKGGTRL